MHLQVDDLAFLRGEDAGARHLVLNREQPVAALGVAILRLGQRRRQFRAVVVLDLDHLLAGLPNGQSRLGDLGADLPHLAARLRQSQPLLGELLLGHKLLPGQARQRSDVLFEQLPLLFSSFTAGTQAVNLLPELIHPAIQNLDLTGMLRAPFPEEINLGLNDFFNPGVASQRLKLLGQHKFIAGVQFRLEPINLGQCAVEARLEQILLGARLGVVQRQQDLPRHHGIPLAHKQFLDDAAFEVLDGLVLAGHLDNALGHHTLGQRGQRTPKNEDEQRPDNHASTNPHRPILHRIDNLVLVNLRRCLEDTLQEGQHLLAPILRRSLNLKVHCVYLTCMGLAGPAGRVA